MTLQIPTFDPAELQRVADALGVLLTDVDLVEVKAQASKVFPVPTFDAEGWVVDFAPAPACENPFDWSDARSRNGSRERDWG